MPEPLSITTAVASLLKATWTVGTELKKFRSGVLTIDKTLKDLENDVDVLGSVLVSAQDTFETITAEDGTGDLAAHWRNVAKIIGDGNGIIGELGDELQDISKTTKFLDASRKQLRLNLAEDKLAHLRVRVQSLRETLQISLQVITIRNQKAHQGALTDLSHEIRRLAKWMNETIERRHAVAQSQQDEVHIAEMMNFRACVRSAASIVSSASTAIKSEGRNTDGSTVMMSDFGDCFPMEQNLAISRWMEAPSVHEYGQGRSLPPPQSVFDAFSVAESAEGSDSDIDLEDEITTTLLEDGQQKLADGNWKDAERVLKKCSLRLCDVTWEQRGGHATRQFAKHAEVLHNLFVIYLQQEQWVEAQSALAAKLSVQERMSRKRDVAYLGDVVALARLLQRRGDTIQALLHARRALKGFKKLQSTVDIKSCLVLLIELCSAEDVEDDEEVYAIMLSRMDMDSPSSSKQTSPKTPASEMFPGVAAIIPMNQHQGNIGQTTAGDEVVNLQVTRRDDEQQLKPSFSILKRRREADGDLLPYETGTDRTTRHRKARIREVLLLEKEAHVQLQGAQEFPMSGRVEPPQGPTMDPSDEDYAVEVCTPTAAETGADFSRPNVGEVDSILDSPYVDKQSEPDVDAKYASTTAKLDRDRDNSPLADDPFEGAPTSDESSAQMRDPKDNYAVSGDHHEYYHRNHRPTSGDGGSLEALDLEDAEIGDGTTLDENQSSLDPSPPPPRQADDMGLTSADHRATLENSFTRSGSRETSLAHSTIDGATTADKLDEFFDAQDWPLPAIANIPKPIRQTSAAQNVSNQPVVNVSDKCNAGSSEEPSIGVDISLFDDDVFSRSGGVVQAQPRVSSEPAGSNDGAVGRDASSPKLSSELCFEQVPGSPSTARFSSSTTADSIINASNATLRRSQTASLASTNLTVPSEYDFIELGDDPLGMFLRLHIKESLGHLREAYPLHDTPSKRRRRRLSLGNQEATLTPRRLPSRRSSWTQDRSDSELWLARREKALPMEGESLKIGSRTKLKDDTPTAIPRLDATNLAEVSGESSAAVAAPKIDNSSVVSIAGTDIAASVKDFLKGTNQKPATSDKKIAHVTLIGDGLCGKTSLMQCFRGGKLSNYWDLGPHHATIPIKMDGHNIEVCVYDAPGQEEHGMIDRYMNSADCIVLCFALDDPTSLENVMNMWIRRVPIRGGRVPTLLVGCKSDLRDNPKSMPQFPGWDQRLLSASECNAALLKIGAAKYLECSAKTGKGVAMVMEAAARAALLGKAVDKVMEATARASLHKRKKSRFNLFSSTTLQL